MAIHTETVKSNHPPAYHKNFNELDLNLLARVEANAEIVSLTFLNHDNGEPRTFPMIAPLKGLKGFFRISILSGE